MPTEGIVVSLKKCKECGGEVSTKAAACPKCGARPEKSHRALKGFVIVVGFFTLMGIIGSQSTPKEHAKSGTTVQHRQSNRGADVSDQARELAWLEKGKQAVKARLKDPKSAEFRNVFFSRGTDGVPCACGEVNARNSLGGYIGYQRFISGGSEDLTFLQNEVADFDVAWARLCGGR